MSRTIPWVIRIGVAIALITVIGGATSMRHMVDPPVPGGIGRGVDLCGHTASEREALSELLALRSRTDVSVLDKTGMTATRSHEILICESGERTDVSVHYRGLPGAQPTSGAAEFAFENRRLIPKNASARFLMR
ncbi:MAG: hypothetical protein IT350_20660 [Deltaproteobacteria bacterium]|nr:hypothetical protein [Deltaproteobacteria bacterium]